MAAAIKEGTGVESEMIAGKGGVFDVKVEGQLIFCKHEVDRFPTHEEILRVLPKGSGR